MICVEFDSGLLRIVEPQPANVSACPFVISSGDALAPWAFESEAFALGVGGVLLMFAVGAGIGIVINALRKVRI